MIFRSPSLALKSAITAKRVKNPRKNVGRASLLGTAASAIVYLAVSAAMMAWCRITHW